MTQSAIRLDGGCSYDPDGSIVSYQWKLIGTDPIGGKANIDINNAPQTGITGLKNGYSYTVQLTVTDNEGAIGVAQVKIQVAGEIDEDPLESFVDFSDSANQLSNYYLETGEPWSFKISDKFNNPSGRFELRYGDKMMGRSTRSQISFNQNTDNEVWIGFSMYIPKNWKPDYTAPEIVFAVHTWSDNGGSRTLSPPFCFVVRDGALTTETRYSHAMAPSQLNDVAIKNTIGLGRSGAPIKGEWMNYVVHIKFDQKEGFLDLWQNGKKVEQYKGPVSYKNTRAPVIGFGPYKWYWDQTGPSDVSRRVIYFDNIKIANSQGFYNLVAPPPTTNIPPIAIVEDSSIEMTLPESSTTMDGSSSRDSDGRIISWKWKQLSGPNAVTITNSASPRAKISNLKEGVYQFEMMITDNSNGTASAIVKVRVHREPNDPGVAEIKGNDQRITLPTSSVVLDGTLSHDNDGKIVSWKWTQTAGPSTAKIASPNSAKTKVSGLQEGTYSFRLTVKDDDGEGSHKGINVFVKYGAKNQPGKAEIKGNDQRITLPTSSVVLDGSPSYDNDGKIVSWKWIQTAGPSTAKIASPNSAKTKVSGLQEGTYSFRLTVKDDDGEGTHRGINVYVKPGAKNQPGKAEIKGNDQRITLPTSSVVLDGSPSYDNDGKIVSWKWTQTAGPSTAKIASPNSAKTKVSGLQEGTYSFRLTVKDDDGEGTYRGINVYVKPGAKNQPGKAEIKGNDQRITLPTSSVVLDGSPSYDNDGKIVSWKWTQTGGPSTAKIASPNSAKTKVSDLQEGTYSFRLTVKDDDGEGTHRGINVYVKPGAKNQPGKAEIKGNDQRITLPTSSVVLDGSPSYDNDGKIVSWRWTQTAGPSTAKIASPNSAKTKVSDLQEGTYSFRLTVKDDDGEGTHRGINVYVKPGTKNQPGKAEIKGNDQRITLPTSSVVLDGSPSYDHDGKIVSWRWTQTAGPSTAKIASPNSAKTKVSDLQEGTYSFRLTVKDDDGEGTHRGINIQVNPRPSNKTTAANQPGIADVKGNNQKITLPTSSVVLDGSTSYDTDGQIVSWEWVQTAGPSKAKIVDPHAARTKVSDLIAGTYSFRLKVLDNDHEGTWAGINIYVKPGVKNQPGIADIKGYDQTITLPISSTVLDGSPSYDKDGKIVSWEWTQTTGPSTANIVSPHAAKTKVTNLQTGTYSFRLKVVDNNHEGTHKGIHVYVKGESSRFGMARKKIQSNTKVNEDSSKAKEYAVAPKPQNQDRKRFKIYPNPTMNMVHFKIKNNERGKLKVSIFDMNGVEVLSRHFEKEEEMLKGKIDVSSLTRGVYVILEKMQVFQTTKKFVKF